MVDLSSLRAIGTLKFDGGALGPLELKTQGQDFMDWLQSASDDRPSLGANDFTRDLLSALAHRADEEASLGEEEVTALDASAIETVADAIFTASGELLRPRYIEIGHGRRRRARRRRSDEPYAMAREPGETASGRLKRVMLAYANDRRLSYRAVMESMTGLQGAFASVLHPYGGTSTSLQQLAGLMGPSGTLSSVLDDLKSPTLRSALDNLRSPAGQVAFEFARSLAGRVDGLGSPLIEIRRRLEEQSFSLSATLGAYQPFSPEFTGAARAIRDLTRSPVVSGMSSGMFASAAHSMRILADHDRFASLVEQQLMFKMPDEISATLRAAEQFRVPLDILSMIPAGFRLTAIVGLDQPLLRGAVADVLARYGEELVDAPIFSGVTRSAVLVDTGADEAAIVGALRSFVEFCWKLITNEPDIIRRNGILSLVALLTAIYSMHLSSRQTELAEKQTELAEKAVHPNPQLADILEETRKVRGDLEAERDGRQARERIRYVHVRVPLRLEPNGKAQLMQFIYPDQYLRVVDASGEWLMVEVMNYKTDAIVRGWTARRNVRTTPLR